MSRLSWLIGILLCCSILASSARRAAAHEIGSTRVVAVFGADGTYRIEITTDAASLVEKLESVADEGPTPIEADPAVLSSRIRALEGIFRSRVHVTFNQVDAQPDLVAVSVGRPAALTGAAASITLRGALPPDASAFTWRYGWTYASYALSMHASERAEAATTWLEGDETSPSLSLSSPARPDGRTRTVRRYLALGFTHILPLGPDHVLFVLGLFLLDSRPRALLAQVSAFTVAHSISLALSMYGVVAVPSRIAEPAIALSIAYVAIENLLLSDLKTWRIWLVFACGLLHGLGFAGVLQDLGLPRREFLAALVSFNVGVEVAQLAVIGGVFLLVGAWFADRSWYRARVVIPASAAIACTAVFWAVQRLPI